MRMNSVSSYDAKVLILAMAALAFVLEVDARSGL
jgi:hypothetical protein